MSKNGLDDLIKKLDDLSKKANEIHGEHEVPFDEIFTSSFMKRYSNFGSIDQFVNDSSFDFSNLDSIDETELDNYVNENTKFNTWKEMFTTGSQEWTARQLGF